MKPLIHLFFLLIAGAASAYGQSAPPASQALPLAPQAFPPTWQGLPSAPRLLPPPGNSLLLPGHRVDIPPGSPIPRSYALLSRDSILTLEPDHMLCLVPNLTRVERMPVRRMTNADRMLNGFGKKRSE
jgi:hypothetical protein